MAPLKRTALAAALVLSYVALGARARAQCELEVTAGDGTSLDRFGSAVAMSGEVMVIGSPADTIGASEGQGSAYVFRYNGTAWEEQQKLTAADGAALDAFGTSVAIDGSVIIVGASGDDYGAGNGQGSATIFRFDGTTWREETTLVAGDGQDGDHFGCAVAVCGDLAVVGAQEDDLGASVDQGSATIFRFDGTDWVEEQRLSANDGEALDHFGESVALAGQILVVGAPDDTVGFNEGQGSAWVYRFDGTTWRAEQQLLASDGAQQATFGWAVTTGGEIIAVGAPRDDACGAIGRGSAYLFRHGEDGWHEEQKLVDSSGEPEEEFGRSVATDGTLIVVGEPDDRTGIEVGQGSAIVYRYRGSTWREEQRLVARDGRAHDRFGASVAVSRGSVAVGAPFHDVGTNADQGSATVFSFLNLVIDPPVVSPGDLLSFDVGLGMTGSPLLLTLVELNGWPQFTTIASGFFDPNGHWTLSAFVPGGLGGLVAGFQAFGIDPCRAVQETAEAFVTFQ